MVRGSNGYWLADIRIWPKHDIIVLMVANVGGDAIEAQFKDTRDVISKQLKPFD